MIFKCPDRFFQLVTEAEVTSLGGVIGAGCCEQCRPCTRGYMSQEETGPSTGVSDGGILMRPIDILPLLVSGARGPGR